jgi:hypothetical protein
MTAVLRRVRGNVPLGHLEEWLNIIPTPSLSPSGSPCVVLGGKTPVVDRCVDLRGATERLSADHVQHPVLEGRRTCIGRPPIHRSGLDIEVGRQKRDV